MHARLDVVGLNAVETALAEVRHEVAAQVAAVVLDRRALALLDRGEVLDVARARLREGLPLRPADDDGTLLHAAPQLGFGLGARQALARSRCPLGAERPLDTPAPDSPPAVPSLDPVRVRSDRE